MVILLTAEKGVPLVNLPLAEPVNRKEQGTPTNVTVQLMATILIGVTPPALGGGVGDVRPVTSKSDLPSQTTVIVIPADLHEPPPPPKVYSAFVLTAIPPGAGVEIVAVTDAVVQFIVALPSVSKVLTPLATAAVTELPLGVTVTVVAWAAEAPANNTADAATPLIASLRNL
jgi:hypothetical protein